MKYSIREGIRLGMMEAQEAAGYQYNPNLFHDLTLEIGKYRESFLKDKRPPETKTIRKTNIDKILQKHTGMSITTEVDPRQDPNAWVWIPFANRNNSIFTHFDQGGRLENEIDPKIKNNPKGIYGEIDIKRGHVSGFFSDIGVSMALTRGLLESPYMGADEVAAILLHEVGHAFSFFESFNRTYRRNYVLESRLKEFRETDDRKIRLRVLDDLVAEDLLDKNFPMNEVVECPDKSKAELLVLTKSQQKIAGDPATLCHDNTMFESAADNFVVRHGGGKSLSSGLAKMYRNELGYFGNAMKYFALGMRWALTAARIGLMVTSFAVLGPVAGTISILYLSLLTIAIGVSEQYFVRYDSGDDRIERMLKEVVTGLKNKAIPDRIRKDLVQDFDTIKKILDDNKSFLFKGKSADQWIVEHCLPFSIANRQSKEYQQTLEELSNNELYVASARFL